MGVDVGAVALSLVGLLLFSSGAMDSGPVPKYGEALCTYHDNSESVVFDFYIAKFQDSYEFKKMNGSTYYVTVTQENEIILVSVAPINRDGHIDGTKSAVGRGFNTITRKNFVDERGEQSLACEAL